MKNLKRLLTLSLTLIMLLVVFALASCDMFITVDDMFSTDLQAMMDDAMTGDNYTMLYEIERGSKTTLKVDDGKMHISVRTDKTYDEYYLYRNEEQGAYYFAHDWKFDDKNKGFERTKLTNEQYVVKYIELYSQYSHNQKLFNYRHILDMAKSVSEDEDHFKYYNEIYEKDEFLRREYEIKYADNALVISEKRTETVLNDKYTNETDKYTLLITNMKTTYSKVGSTEISFPAKVTN